MAEDIGPGDKVICITAGLSKFLISGTVYIVEVITDIPGSLEVMRSYGINTTNAKRIPCAACGRTDLEEAVIKVEGINGFYCLTKFRKQQPPRNLEQWLSQDTKYEEPKRVPSFIVEDG